MIEKEQKIRSQEAGPLFGSADVVVVEPVPQGISRRGFLKRCGFIGMAAVALELGLTGCDGPQVEDIGEVLASIEPERIVTDVVNEIRQIEKKYPVGYPIPRMMEKAFEEWRVDLEQMARLGYELSFWDSEGKLPGEEKVSKMIERVKILDNPVDLNEERKRIDSTAIDINSIDGAFTAGLSFWYDGGNWVLINGIDPDIQNMLTELGVPLMGYFRSVMMHEYEHTKSKAIELGPDELTLPNGSEARTVKVADGARLMEKMPYSSEENFGVLSELDEHLVDEAISQIGVEYKLNMLPQSTYKDTKECLISLFGMIMGNNESYDVIMERWVKMARKSKIIEILDDLASMLPEKTADLSVNERRGWSVFVIDDALQGGRFLKEALNNPRDMWNKLNDNSQISMVNPTLKWTKHKSNLRWTKLAV
jgi:hypothetical protein